MPLYECVFIARQDISASQAEILGNTFAQIIRDQGGQVTKTEYWGLRALAYKIKKNRKGHYLMYNIDAPPPAVTEMERNMRLNEDVLRFLTVRVDALEAGQSAMMLARAERTERGDRGGRREGERGDREHRGGDREHRGGGDREHRGGDRGFRRHTGGFGGGGGGERFGGGGGGERFGGDRGPNRGDSGDRSPDHTRTDTPGGV